MQLIEHSSPALLRQLLQDVQRRLELSNEEGFPAALKRQLEAEALELQELLLNAEAA